MSPARHNVLCTRDKLYLLTRFLVSTFSSILIFQNAFLSFKWRSWYWTWFHLPSVELQADFWTHPLILLCLERCRMRRLTWERVSEKGLHCCASFIHLFAYSFIQVLNNTFIHSVNVSNINFQIRTPGFSNWLDIGKSKVELITSSDFGKNFAKQISTTREPDH